MTRGLPSEDLFIYDLANNHQGDLAHASEIVRCIGEVNAAGHVAGALKFQFRQLDSFIHEDFKRRLDHKYVRRFSETRLETKAFAHLADLVRQAGMLTMCTPFDEESVDVAVDMGIEILKVASCSADDWPLLEKVARARKPVVASTAGLRIQEVDLLVNFFETERVEVALMHCVALYPTPDNLLRLNQIRGFRDRYRGIAVGWSTHENPDNVSAVQIAYACGARLFERHVGIETGEYKLNANSSTPQQVARWIAAYHHARSMMGGEERPPTGQEERDTLVELKRGAYVRRAVARGNAITDGDVFFAMPVQSGQLTSGQWRTGLAADRDYQAGAPLSDSLAEQSAGDERHVYQIMLQVRAMLNEANIAVNADAEIEISHHYGLARFREHGAVIITCINRSYAKKLVVQLPRQKHPYHFHKKKEETFQLLAGDLEVSLDGNRSASKPGDTFLVQPGQWHEFHTLDGCIFEEISTTHYDDDSFYEDPVIARMERCRRKTRVEKWAEYFSKPHAV